MRCPSSVVNNFFKHLLLLLPNCWANLDQTWQECSLGGPLQKLFTEFDSIKNSGCHGNEIEFFMQFFKNFFLWNRWSDFEKNSQKCCLGDPFQKVFAKFWCVQKHGAGEWGLLALYWHEEILIKSSQKLLVWFWNNFTGMFLRWPFSKLFAQFWSVHKHNSGEWGLLALYGHKKFLKNLLFWNRRPDFEIISQECSLCDPFQKMFAKFWSVHKHGSGKWGLFALYGHEEEIHKKSLKPLVKF